MGLNFLEYKCLRISETSVLPSLIAKFIPYFQKIWSQLTVEENTRIHEVILEEKVDTLFYLSVWKYENSCSVQNNLGTTQEMNFATLCIILLVLLGDFQRVQNFIFQTPRQTKIQVLIRWIYYIASFLLIENSRATCNKLANLGIYFDRKSTYCSNSFK